MKIKLTFSICLILLSKIALANGNVCIDPTGKKIFSDIACEKRGLQAAKSEFVVIPQDNVQPVFVVTAKNIPTTNIAIAPTLGALNKIEKRASPWSGDVPLKGVAWFIISLMPIAAIFFLGFHLFLFIKARLRKYRHVRSAMESQNS